MSNNKTRARDMDEVLRNSFQYVEQNHQEFSKEIIDLNESKYIPSSMNHMVLTTWICDNDNDKANTGTSNKQKLLEKKKKKNKNNDNIKKRYVIHKNDLQPNLYFPLPTDSKNTNISNNFHNLHIYKSINVKSKDEKRETLGGQDTGFIDNFSVNAINSKYNNHDVEFVEYTTINVPLKYGEYFVDYSWMPLTKQEMDLRMKARNTNNKGNTNTNNTTNTNTDTDTNTNTNNHDSRKEDICVVIVTNTHFLYFDLNNGNSTLLRQGRSVYAGIDFVRMVENDLLKGFQKAFFFNELIKNFNKNQENINDCDKYKPQCALWCRLFKKKPVLNFLNKNFSTNLPELAYDFDLKNNVNCSRSGQNNNNNSSSSNNNNNGVNITMNNVNDVNNINNNMENGNSSVGNKANNVNNIAYGHLQNKLHYVAMEAMYGPMITSEKDRNIIIKDYQLSGDDDNDDGDDDDDNDVSIGSNPGNGNTTRHSRSINHDKFLDEYITKFYDQWAEKYGVEFGYYEDFTKNHNSAKTTILNEGNQLVLDKILNLFFTVLDNGIVVLDIDGYTQLPIFLNMEKKMPSEHVSSLESNESGLLSDSNDFVSEIESNYKLKLYDNFTLLMYNEKDVIVCNIQHLFDNYLILDMIESEIRLKSLFSYWRIVLNEKIIDLSVKPFTKFWTSLRESYEMANEKKKKLNLIEDLILLFSTGEYSIDLKNWFVNTFGSKNYKKWHKLFNEMYDITLQLTMLNSCVERMFIELNQLDSYAKGFCFVNQLKFIPSYLSCVDKLKAILKEDFLIKLNILSNTDLKLEYEKHLKFLKWIGMWCAHFEDEDKPIKITPPEDINMILDFMLEVLQNIDIVNEDISISDDGSKSVEKNSGLVLLNFQKSNHMNLMKMRDYSNCVKIDFASFLSLLLNNDVDFFESINESFKIKDVSVINDSIHCIQHSELENSLQIYNLEHEVCIVDLIKDFVEEEEEEEEKDKKVSTSNTTPLQTTKKDKIKKDKIKRLKIKEVLFANDNFTNSSFNNFDVNITYF